MSSARTSSVALPCVTTTGTFARFEPFGDKRYVVERRGDALGFHYGVVEHEDATTIDGAKVALRTYSAVLSPPPISPGSAPSEAGDTYRPRTLVAFLPDAEIAIRLTPNGFSDDEVSTILAAISIT